MTTANELLNELNTFRATEGKEAFKDWRKARHMPMLEAYRTSVEAAAEEAPVTAVDSETVEEVEEVEVVKVASYKELARASAPTSTVVKPVELVRNFLDANPEMGRKQAVAALVGMGVNFSTARTQYQKWFTARKA